MTEILSNLIGYNGHQLLQFVSAYAGRKGALYVSDILCKLTYIPQCTVLNVLPDGQSRGNTAGGVLRTSVQINLHAPRKHEASY